MEVWILYRGKKSSVAGKYCRVMCLRAVDGGFIGMYTTKNIDNNEVEGRHDEGMAVVKTRLG